MTHNLDRKSFLKSMAIAGAGVTLSGSSLMAAGRDSREPGRIGIIGLDTSHSIAFTDLINDPDDGEPTGFEVVAATKYGSRDIESSYSRIPEYTESMRERGIEIVDSIRQLLDQVDYVLLETNDGHPRLEQALQVIEAGKPMFVDKPVAGSLQHTIRIYHAAEQRGVPIFSSSGLRYVSTTQQVRHEGIIGDVLGAEAFSPAMIEPTHPDLFWYGIHGVETIFTCLGTGCKSVRRVYTEGTDLVVGMWEGERIGTFRGIREGQHSYGGRAFGSEGNADLGNFEGYGMMVDHILDFFRTGRVPIDPEETLEIYAFMEAADESVRQNGGWVRLSDVMSRARRPN